MVQSPPWSARGKTLGRSLCMGRRVSDLWTSPYKHPPPPPPPPPPTHTHTHTFHSFSFTHTHSLGNGRYDPRHKIAGHSVGHAIGTCSHGNHTLGDHLLCVLISCFPTYEANTRKGVYMGGRRHEAIRNTYEAADCASAVRCSGRLPVICSRSRLVLSQRLHFFRNWS